MLPHDIDCAQPTARHRSAAAICDLEPCPVWPIEDAEQCVEAIEGLALDIGYFADLIQATRRLDEIREWIARETARLEAACPCLASA